MTPEELTRTIRSEARSIGFDLVGFARAGRVADEPRLGEWLERGYHGTMHWMTRHRSKRVDPRELVPGCRSIVSIGLLYSQPASIGPQPTGVQVARYAWGEDYHRVLKDKLAELLVRGRRLDPDFQGRAFTDSAPVMDKYWAEQAGVGWRGKNTNLINKRLGSYLFLGELLVRAETVPDEPGTDHCGTCTRCLDACPTDAFSEPYVLDSRKCIAYWTIEHREGLTAAEEEAIGDWLFGCDVCQQVCPWNEGAPHSSEPRFSPTSDTWPGDVDGLLHMNEEEFSSRFGGTAVERTRRRGFVRNAAIVAGNTGLGSETALADCVRDADQIVADTARRAVKRRADPC